MQPQNGNTFAISLGRLKQHEDLMPKLRVRYYHVDYFDDTMHKPIESVLCADLYADKIQMEMDGTSESTQFSDIFLNKTKSDQVWICPNLTSS